MHPAVIAAISSVAVLIVAELLRWAVRSMQSSTFSDVEREYIDERIVHKLNNYRIEADAKFVHKRTPRLE